MGMFSKIKKGISSGIKSIGKKTGIDKIITDLPGSKQDLANAAKIAAVAAAVYFGGGALMSSFGSGAAGAGTAAGAAGAGSAGAGGLVGSAAGAGALGGAGAAAGMESVLATAPAWGGIGGAGAAAAGAGAAGAVGSLYNSGSLFNAGNVGDGAVGAGADGSIGTLYGANSGLSSLGMTPEAMSALQGGTSGGGMDWMKLLGGNNGVGANLGGALGSYLGGNQQAQGYADAQKILEQMGQQANYASQLSDPFQKYRSSYAQQLDDTMQGRRSITTDPGYQFQFNEGQRAVERAAGARGMGNSGNVMTALQQRGQDVASQQYGTIIDRLTNLAGASGQNAAQGGSIYGNMMGTAMTGQASAALGQGMTNAASTGGVSSGLGGALGSLAGSYLGSQSGQNMISKIGSYFV